MYHRVSFFGCIAALAVILIAPHPAYSQSCSMSKPDKRFLVAISPDDSLDFHANEEQWLRKLGVIDKNQDFNGIIYEDQDENFSILKRCCIYVHDGGPGSCGSTYKKKCFHCNPPKKPKKKGVTINEFLAKKKCADKATAAYRLDEPITLLLSPRDQILLQDNPAKVFRAIAGIPKSETINGVWLKDEGASAQAMRGWKMKSWCHITQGTCRSNYVPCEADKSVSPPDFVPEMQVLLNQLME